MIVALISVLLMLASAAGVAFLLLSSGGLTVDALFFTLILATMFLIFAANAAYELRGLRRRRAGADKKPGDARVVAPTPGEISAGHAAKAQPAAPVSAEPALPRRRPLAELGPKEAPQPYSVEGLSAGSVLIREGTPTRDAVRFRPGSCYADWKLAEGESAARLERPLREAGLEIFFLVGSIEGSAFAFGRKQAVKKALARVLETIGAPGRNAAEIRHIKAAKLLGLHSVTIAAAPRHIQEKPFVLQRPEKARLMQMPQPVIGTEDESSQVTPAQAA